jgi:hypothetical protein
MLRRQAISSLGESSGLKDVTLVQVFQLNKRLHWCKRFECLKKSCPVFFLQIYRIVASGVPEKGKMFCLVASAMLWPAAWAACETNYTGLRKSCSVWKIQGDALSAVLMARGRARGGFANVLCR